MQEKESKIALLEKPTQTQTETQIQTKIQKDLQNKPENQTSLNLKELKKEHLFTSTVIETPNYDFIEVATPSSNVKTKTETEPKVDTKFRFRLIVAVYCIIIAVCGIWVISNAVQMNSLSSSITEANNAYMINEAQYILKISELDAIEPDDDGSLSPIAPENIFGVQAEKLSNPTDPTISTSWFDKVCNWLSGVTGG